MGSLKPKESIPSCLQSTQLIRSNQETNLVQILAKSWRKNILPSTTGSPLPSPLPTTDGRPYPTVAGRPQERNFYDESMKFNCSSQFLLLIESKVCVLDSIDSRFFIGSWSFKSSTEILQIKEEILGEIGSKFNNCKRIHIISFPPLIFNF
ncbi:hypothetical protein M9H77_22019 [Catharanthus roseus]|uniref:Uncharacterized protein n=1 Tax=Catharanthus roseus TaxID=4058 RepID=A0ACC0APN8_CATRO|nr:hypothetical protein M9H77_22019 [Catharanthus roseus]